MDLDLDGVVRQYGDSQSWTSSISVNGGAKFSSWATERTTAEFSATNSKAFDDSEAWSKDIYMLHQEKVVKKEEGLMNENLPDHVFSNSKQNKGNDNTGNKAYSKKGRDRQDSMELKHSATFKKLGMDPENKNNRADQSGFLVSDSQKEKPIEALKRMWRSLIRRKKKDKVEGSKGECLSKSLLGLDDSTNRRPSPDFDATEIDDFCDSEIDDLSDTEIDDLTERNSRLDSKATELGYSTRNSLPDFDATETSSLPGSIEYEGVKATPGRGWNVKNLEQSDLGDTGTDGLTERNSLMYFDATEFDDSAQSNSLICPEIDGIVSDLLRFISDKECYKTKSKAWKRGYLLRDSPCTDRSSRIAAMANCLEFDICNLHLTGVSCISDLTNVLISIGTRSVIVIKDFDDWFAMVYPKHELTLADLLIIMDGLLSSCGDEQIIVLTTNHNHIDRGDLTLLHPLDLDIYIETPSPQPKALPYGGEIVLLDSSEQKPLVDVDAANNSAYQSDVLLSNSVEKNMREATKRQCMPEDVLSLVDSPTRISSTDFDAPDKSVHPVYRAYQSSPIVFNSVRKDTGDGLNVESPDIDDIAIDDSTESNSLPDSYDADLYATEIDDLTETNSSLNLDATENKAAMVDTMWGRSWNSMKLEQPPTFAELGKYPENDGIISDLLRFISDKECYKTKSKAWKRGYLLRNSPGTDRSSLIAAMANCLEFDICNLHLTGVSCISDLTNVLVSIGNRSVIVIKDFDDWFAMLYPNYKLALAGLLIIIHGILWSCGDERVIVLATNHHNHIDSVNAAQLCHLSIDVYIETSSAQPKSLPDGEEIVLFDSPKQKPPVDFDATSYRAYQSDVLVSNSEDTREASRRQCMPEDVLSLAYSMSSSFDCSTSGISSIDFDAPAKSAHQSGSILSNSVRKATGEGLNGGCLSKSLLSLDDSIKSSNSLPDIDGTEIDDSTKANFSLGLYDAELVDLTEPNPSPYLDATENKEAMVYTTQERDWNSMELEQPPNSAELGKDPENDGIISDLVGFVRDKAFCESEGKAWKRAYLLRDSPGSDRSSLIDAMANFLEFDICDLHPTNAFSIWELTNAVASIRSRSVIVIKDFDRWHAMIFPKYRLTLARLLIIMRGFLSSCGDERIIVLTTNHNHIDKGGIALLRPLNLDIYIETSSTQPKALTDGGEIVLLDSSKQKPLVDVDAANNSAYQSDVLVSNSVEKNMREASRRQCMPECLLNLVNALTGTSSTDFDAPDKRIHPVYRAYQSGPIVFNSVRKDMEDRLNGESPDIDAIEIDDSKLKQPLTFEDLGKDPENDGIISDLLGFVRDKEVYKSEGKAWKRAYVLWDSPATDRSSLIAAMSNCLEFDIYNLHLTDMSSILELMNVLVSIRNRSVIVIKDFDRLMLPHLKNEVTLPDLLKTIHDLLSSCGDERIIVLTTNHNHIDRVDVALLHPLNIDIYIETSSPQPKASPDGAEMAMLDSLEQKPSVDVDAINNRVYDRDILLSSPEEKNMRVASRRQFMPEGLLSLVDSSTDFDAPDHSVVMPYQTDPTVFNWENKDTGEGLSREFFSESGLDDLTERSSLLDFDAAEIDDSTETNPLLDIYATENKAVKVHTTWGLAWDSEELEQPLNLAKLAEDQENESIFSDLQGFVRNEEFYKSKGKPWKRGYLLYDSPGTDRSALTIAVANCLEFRNDLDLTGLTTILELTNVMPSIKNRSLIAIKDIDSWFAMLPNLKNESTSSSRWPISLLDGGHIVLLDPLDQPTKHVEHVAVVDQSSPTLSLAEKKLVRNTLKRKCRTMSVIFEDNHQHLARRCEGGGAKSLGVMRIFREHGINLVSTLKQIKELGIYQWPFFQQKWAARKRYSLGKERPFAVGFLSMDEKLDSRLQLIHTSQFARSTPWALALPDGGEIIRPTVLSSSETAATNNIAQLVGQDQSGHTSSHYEHKNTRETPEKQGLEYLVQHFGCKHDHAVKSLADSGSIKSSCRQHWVYQCPDWFENDEHQAFDGTSNRTHLVTADERGPTGSNSEKGNTREPLKRDCLTRAFGLENLQHSGARHKDAVKGLCDSLAWKSFEVLDTLPLGKQSNSIIYLARQRTLTHKHCVRLKKSQDLPRSMLRDSSGGLAAQSDIGLPDGGHILSLSEKKIVRKTLKRKCRTMSVLNLEDHQQHVGSRWEDDVKFLGTKRICRQLAMHLKTRAKRIHRQLGTHQWLIKQSAISLPDGGHNLSLSEKKTARKTLKRKCRSTSVLSLDNQKQHVDRRWDDAAKSHGTKRICRQRVIHGLSIAKHIHIHTGIHLWPFERCAIGLPDVGHILPLSRKKIVRETLKSKGKVKRVLILVDRQKHVDRRWEDDEKSIGVKPICRHPVSRRVSIAKRICRQCGICHRWPFQQDWATMKGYSLGDKRLDEVIRLSTYAKLDSRLELICISWLGRFSPRPSGLTGGGDIGGPIALSSSEFAASKNIAQHVGQDQSGSAAFDSENERTRKQGYPEEINATISRDAIMRHYGRRNREDAAANLQISVSTFKRKCREYGIKRWPQIRREKAFWRPPDQHEEKIPPSACKTLSTNGETLLDFVEGPTEAGFSSEAARGDKIGGPIALSLSDSAATENIAQRVGQDQSVSLTSDSENERTREQGDPKEINATITLDAIRQHYGRRNRKNTAASLHISVATFKRKCREFGIQRWPHVRKRKAVLRPPDQHGEKNPSSTCKTLSTNGQTEMENEMFGHLEEMNEFLLDFVEGPNEAGVSSEWAFLQRNQWTVSTTHPNSNDLVVPHPHISSQILGEDMGSFEDWGNSFATLEEPLLPRHDSGSVSTVPPRSYAAPSQPMPTIAHTLESSEDRRNSLVSSEDVFPEEHVSRSLLASAEAVSLEEHVHTTGSSDDLRHLLASGEEPFSAGDVSGLMNWTVPSCFHPAPSQSMPITVHTRPTVPPMMPFHTGSQDIRSVMLKATYRDITFKFELPLTSGIRKLKEEVSKRLEVGPGSYHVEYKDVDGTWIIINCDEDVRVYLQLFTSLGNQVIELRIRDKDPNTTKYCQCGRSLKRKRP